MTTTDCDECRKRENSRSAAPVRDPPARPLRAHTVVHGTQSGVSEREQPQPDREADPADTGGPPPAAAHALDKKHHLQLSSHVATSGDGVSGATQKFSINFRRAHRKRRSSTVSGVWAIASPQQCSYHARGACSGGATRLYLISPRSSLACGGPSGAPVLGSSPGAHQPTSLCWADRSVEDLSAAGWLEAAVRAGRRAPWASGASRAPPELERACTHIREGSCETEGTRAARMVKGARVRNGGARVRQ